MKQITWIIAGYFALTAPLQAASFDCDKAATTIEHLICDNPTLSKLDDDLDAEYKKALQDHTRADATRLSQKQWLHDRDSCSERSAIEDRKACLQILYSSRIQHLQFADIAVQSSTTSVAENPKTATGISQGDDSHPSSPSGRFVLMKFLRATPEVICKRFEGDLNQFRYLDFDQCNPRLSAKFPEFSRPYTWKEIPFDMALAEKAIRSTENIVDLRDPEMIAEAHEIQEKRWLTWKKDSEPFRLSGKAHMWITKIDLYSEGKDDTILKMIPGGRSGIDPNRLSLWPCDYNSGELYIVDSASTEDAARFNAQASSSSDIIHYAEDNHFYLLSWNLVASRYYGSTRYDPLPDIGGTRSVEVLSLFHNKGFGISPGPVCFIDWVPKEGNMPASTSK